MKTFLALAIASFSTLSFASEHLFVLSCTTDTKKSIGVAYTQKKIDGLYRRIIKHVFVEGFDFIETAKTKEYFEYGYRINEITIAPFRDSFLFLKLREDTSHATYKIGNGNVRMMSCLPGDITKFTNDGL